MMAKPLQGSIISDFTVNHLADFLENDENEPKVKIKISPFGQVQSLLANPSTNFWKKNFDFLLIWTQLEKINQPYDRLLNNEKVSLREILREIDEFSLLIKKNAKNVKAVFLPTWVLPASNRGWGMLDWKETGPRKAITLANLRLANNLSDTGNIFILDSELWFFDLKKDFNAKLWYMAKIPFSDEVYKNIASDIKSSLRGLTGQSKKLIILDLDDTLWGGIVGDLGWQKLNIGGHNFIGEAFYDFQKGLKALKNRGVLLGIVSKNEESVALEAIKKHPEMVLKLDDFAGWKINWQDKAQNVLDLVKGLNLGLQSVVFIDDNPIERARVKEELSEVLVPEWPEDKTLYKSTLLSLNVFDVSTVSKEDLKRTKMYVEERKRTDLKTNVDSLDKWLENLKIKVKIEELNKENLTRAAQLFNKTNQLNLKTRRLVEGELFKWAKAKNHFLYTFRVSDKFGDSGLTGIAGIEVKNKIAEVSDFILSCRVMGRKIEETMLFALINKAKEIKLEKFSAEYIKTKKNKPVFDFFLSSGLEKKKNTFYWDLKKNYKKPDWIKLI